jgi:DNA processing protein
LSKGCHKLIREGAKLVQTAQDILEELGMTTLAADANAQNETPAKDPERSVLEALGGDSADVDTLVARTALPSDVVVAALTNLELTGRVAAIPGGLWQRLHRS